MTRFNNLEIAIRSLTVMVGTSDRERAERESRGVNVLQVETHPFQLRSGTAIRWGVNLKFAPATRPDHDSRTQTPDPFSLHLSAIGPTPGCAN